MSPRRARHQGNVETPRFGNIRLKPIHQLVHILFLLLDGFDQFELGAAAVEIVAFAVHLEISIARQEISQEADADFERDELAGKSQMLFFRPLSGNQPPTRDNRAPTPRTSGTPSCTFDRSRSSSLAGLVVVRTMSPKS